MPAAVVVPTREDALRLVGKQRHAERFEKLAAATHDACPELRGWIARRPLVVLEHAEEWPKILAVIVCPRRTPAVVPAAFAMGFAGVDSSNCSKKAARAASIPGVASLWEDLGGCAGPDKHAFGQLPRITRVALWAHRKACRWAMTLR
jgi:hypothetical protein